MDIVSNIEFARDTTPECRANSVRRIAGTIVVITIVPARDLRAIQRLAANRSTVAGNLRDECSRKEL
jgi:hypothetical protein